MKFLSAVFGSFFGTLLALVVFSAGLYVAFQTYEPQIVDYVSNQLAGPVGDAIQSKVAESLPTFG